MIKYKKGFTLIELILVMGMFSIVLGVLFAVFRTDYMRMEAQGRETYLQQDIDRGLTQLSNRLMGATKINEKDGEELLNFNYYYRDNTTLYTGKIYLEENTEMSAEESVNINTLKFDSWLAGESPANINTNIFMSHVETLAIDYIDESGGGTVKENVTAVEINYRVLTSFRTISKSKDGTLRIKLRNIK